MKRTHPFALSLTLRCIPVQTGVVVSLSLFLSFSLPSLPSLPHFLFLRFRFVAPLLLHAWHSFVHGRREKEKNELNLVTTVFRGGEKGSGIDRTAAKRGEGEANGTIPAPHRRRKRGWRRGGFDKRRGILWLTV